MSPHGAGGRFWVQVGRFLHGRHQSFFLINLISVCFVHCWPFHRKDRTLFLTQFYVAMNSWRGKELVFDWGRKLLTNFSVTHTCGL